MIQNMETNIEKITPLGGQYMYVAITPDGTRVPVDEDDYRQAIELAKLPNICAIVYLEPGKFTIAFSSPK